MDAYEIARRASLLPGLFAARIPAETLEGLRLMEEGGEYGELTIELTATLAKTGASASLAEQQELRALLEATHMPTEPAEQLEVHG
ncbi:MAG: hypothetical protein ABJB47_06170 [Actinomycetota bacterium]